MDEPLLKLNYFCDEIHFPYGDILKEFPHHYDILPKIGSLISTLKKNLDPNRFKEVNPGIFIAQSARIDPRATLVGPCIIGENCLIKPGAFIRENVLLGENCTVGNSSEIKNSILFNFASVPHFNYVGDSLLGYKAHLGAGVILSNLKSTGGEVVLNIRGKRIPTGLRKFGAIIGDHAEIGCNAVLFPGSLIGKGSIVYPLVPFKGTLESGKLVKNKTPLEVVNLD